MIFVSKIFHHNALLYCRLHPLIIECNLQYLTLKCCHPNNDDNKTVNGVTWGNRDIDQINKYAQICCDHFTKLKYSSQCLECNSSCTKHFVLIDTLYTDIITCLQQASIASTGSRCESRKRVRVAGWNYHIKDLHERARSYFKCWVNCGKPSSGTSYEQMCNSRK